MTKMRPRTKAEILQLINDNPNMWIKDGPEMCNRITVIDIEDDREFIVIGRRWLCFRELLYQCTYSLTLLGEYKKFEVAV
jgi:hypothetical protein